MIRLHHIQGSFILLLLVIYMLFGDAGDLSWARFDMTGESLMTLFMGALIMKSYKDKWLRMFIIVFMGIALFKLLFNAYGFIDMEGFLNINNAYWTGGIIVGCLIVYLIYYVNELVKR